MRTCVRSRWEFTPMGTPAGTGFEWYSYREPTVCFFGLRLAGRRLERRARRPGDTRGRETKDSRCAKLPCNQSYD